MLNSKDLCKFEAKSKKRKRRNSQTVNNLHITCVDHPINEIETRTANVRGLKAEHENVRSWQQPQDRLMSKKTPNNHHEEDARLNEEQGERDRECV